MNPVTFYSNTEICRVCPRTVNLINLYDPSNKTVLNDLNLIVYIEVSFVLGILVPEHSIRPLFVFRKKT